MSKDKNHNKFKLYLMFIIISMTFCKNRFTIYSNNKKNKLEEIQLLDVFDYNDKFNGFYKFIYADNMQTFLDTLKKLKIFPEYKIGILLIDIGTMQQINFFLIINQIYSSKIDLFIMNDIANIRGPYLNKIFEIKLIKIKDEDFDRISKLDFLNDKSDYVAEIIYEDKSELKIDAYNDYLYAVVYIGLIASIIISIFWHYLAFKFYRHESSSLQKILLSLPFLQVFYFISLYIYIESNTKMDDDNKNVNIWTYIYLDTFFLAFKYIYKTIFWFIIVMITYGWHIYKFMLQRTELRKFVALYVLIYILVCPDQILDSIFPHKILAFKLSELKNIIIYLFLLIIIIKLFYSSITVINRKLHYATIFASNFINEFKIKKNILLIHFVTTILYVLSYILQMFYVKYNFKSNDAEKILQININLNDFVFMIFYLINLRPRKFPNFYYVNIEDMDNSNETMMNLYLIDLKDIKHYVLEDRPNNKKYKIKNFNGMVKDAPKKLKKEIFENKENIPIVIINPIFPVYDRINYISREETEINNKIINFNSINENNHNQTLSFIDSHSNQENSNRRVYINDKINIGFIE